MEWKYTYIVWYSSNHKTLNKYLGGIYWSAQQSFLKRFSTDNMIALPCFACICKYRSALIYARFCYSWHLYAFFVLHMLCIILFTCMYACFYVHVLVCIFLCVRVCAHVLLFTCSCSYVCRHVFVYTYIFYVFVYTCMCAHVCVHSLFFYATVIIMPVYVFIYDAILNLYILHRIVAILLGAELCTNLDMTMTSEPKLWLSHSFPTLSLIIKTSYNYSVGL